MNLNFKADEFITLRILSPGGWIDAVYLHLIELMFLNLADLKKCNFVLDNILLYESFNVRGYCRVKLSYEKLAASRDGIRLVAILIEVLIAQENDESCAIRHIFPLLLQIFYATIRNEVSVPAKLFVHIVARS